MSPLPPVLSPEVSLSFPTTPCQSTSRDPDKPTAMFRYHLSPCNSFNLFIYSKVPSAYFGRIFYRQKHRATTANMDQHIDGVVERL